MATSLDALGPVGGLIVLLGIPVLFFLPAVIAFFRHHPGRWVILALNVFAGWTILIWIGALAWSVSGKTPPAREPPRPTGGRARQALAWLMAEGFLLGVIGLTLRAMLSG